LASDRCLDERTVVAFVAGRIDAATRSTVAAHLDSCSSCTELTVLAAADLAHHSAPPGKEGVPYIGGLLPGSRVDRYQILGAVGRGGMGEVYAAYHPDLDRRIALKVVAESGADSAERRARLLREARTIARLSHPNIVAVYDAGTVDDRVYIAMEFVEGETVDAWLRSQPRGWREIVDVFVAAGRGLAAAHAGGVIHRDFKPQNVMVGRDGNVRVMDFGLARLAEEPADTRVPDDDAPDRPAAPPTVTKTGALIGTIAYMSPEQFRREPLDARSDQFSFCVALHEAIYGRRPELGHLDASAIPPNASGDKSANTRGGNAPGWLRAVVARGLATDRDKRFPSMDALLAAARRGQNRIRRRAATLAVVSAVAVVALAGWRLAAVRPILCAVPKAKLAAVWSTGNDSGPRRRSVHSALARRGPGGENTWRLVAKALDDYTSQWSAMYVETCEATHLQGDQSAEVLDLRMSCLRENLDGVRALTDVLARADAQVPLSEAVSAAHDLPVLSRCADVVGLRAAVPPPRDSNIAHRVDALRPAISDATALEAVGSHRAALEKALRILPDAEATGYRPLIAEVQYLVGTSQADSASADAAAMLEKALYSAEASRDDVTAAKAALFLVGVVGYRLNRPSESQRWANLASSILDRLSPPPTRLRAWLLHGEAAVLNGTGHFAAARSLFEQALSLKKAELGENDPDVARTMAALAWSLNGLGRPDEALRLSERAVQILGEFDPDGIQLAYARDNQGDALLKLGRYREAETSYLAVLRALQAQFGPSHPDVALALHGLAEAKVGQGDIPGAIHYFEDALRIRRRQIKEDPVALAETEFALARALAASGGDRHRARKLATAARAIYASHDEHARQRELDAWLGTRRAAAPGDVAHAGDRR